MKTKSEIIETSPAKVWLGDDGIYRAVLKSGVVVGLIEMKENLETQVKVQGTMKTPTLVDMREIKNSSHEAREFAASEEYGKAISAVATLQNTTVGKILGNLFINFSKPIYPTKLFTSEDAAIDWLKDFVSTASSEEPQPIGAVDE